MVAGDHPDLMTKKTFEQWLDAPPEGHRAPLETGDHASDCSARKPQSANRSDGVLTEIRSRVSFL
jgi:hypothetical protein